MKKIIKRIKEIWEELLGICKNGLKKFNKFSLKKKLIISGIFVLLLAIIIGSIYYFKLGFKKAPKQVYEAAIMVRDQYNSDPAEDARTSLKAGDVVVVQKDGHSWSNTERISYLILKLNLTADEAAKLTQPEERKLNRSEIKDEEKKRLDQVKDDKEKDRIKKEMENRKKTLRTRQYRIKMEDFKGFDAMQLLEKQPYLDKVYDWGIVDKK